MLPAARELWADSLIRDTMENVATQKGAIIFHARDQEKSLWKISLDAATLTVAGSTRLVLHSQTACRLLIHIDSRKCGKEEGFQQETPP